MNKKRGGQEVRAKGIVAVIALVILVSISTVASASASASTASYVVVGTGQSKCYDNSAVIPCPRSGEAFFGQDAQYAGSPPSYALSCGGLTVYDNNTGLTWQRSPDTNGDGTIEYSDKLTFTQAQAQPGKLNAVKYCGYSDWRLPTVKELYSLINFNGAEPAPDASTSAGATPFIDTNYFGFSYGFTNYPADNTGRNERVIDSQYVTTTLYVANPNQMFGVNFADGRIKAYPKGRMSGINETCTPFFACICQRGGVSLSGRSTSPQP